MKRSGRHLFCEKHRSHFCPCTGAIRYHNQAQAIKDWDAAAKEYEEKKEARRDPGAGTASA